MARLDPRLNPKENKCFNLLDNLDIRKYSYAENILTNIS